jgi:hypothetical protein
MDCDEVRERLLEYRERQLDLPAQTSLEAHLLICERCLGELHDLDALLSALAAEPIPEPSPAAGQRLRMRIAAERARAGSGRLRWAGWRTTLATAGLLVVVGTTVGPVLPRRGSHQHDLERSTPSIASTIDDGSLEAALSLWQAPLLQEREMLDAFVGLMELPDAEVEDLLAQLRG